MNIIKRIQNRITRSIANSMTLPLGRQFLRWGTKAVSGEWANVFMRDEDHYTGMSFAAMHNRASTAATVAKDNLHTQSNEKEFEHPYLEKIKDSPNFSEFWFWFYISILLDLEGVMYIMAVRNISASGRKYGEIQSLKLLNPYHVQRILDPQTLEVTGYVETRGQMQRNIPKHMIIEVRELNPFDEDTPFARSDAAKDSQFTLKTAADYTRSALQGNINSPGILSTGVILEDEQWENFKSSIANHRKGEPVFANGPGVIDWKDMQVDVNKAALKDVGEMNLKSLLAVYGMSKTTMGIEESGTTRETARVQEGLLLKMHVIPRLQLIVDALNQDYKTHYPEEYARNKAVIMVDNPANVDKEAEKADTEVKRLDFDLYASIMDKGYEPDLAAQYVKGEIEVDGLGEPTRETEQETNDEKLGNLIRKMSKNNRTLVESQTAVLENAIVNVDQQLLVRAIDRIPSIVPNALDSESDLITLKDKAVIKNELMVVLNSFYNVVFVLEGNDHSAIRARELGFEPDFSLDANVRRVIAELTQKVAQSHVDTVSQDLYNAAREAALAEKSQQGIISALRSKYSYDISVVRARAVSRTETNRAFSASQLLADQQLAKKNGFEDRAYKKWRINSANPCGYCLQLASEGEIPLFDNFRDLGSTISEAGGKGKLKVNFTSIEAGCAHTNCSCDYEFVIRKEKK
jgi:hypothetical protein